MGSDIPGMSSQKSMVNKPEVFKRSIEESLDSFIGHMALYLAQVPENMKLNVAISFLGGHAFDWFKVTIQVKRPLRDS